MSVSTKKRTIKNKNKPLIFYNMKTNVHYSSIKPVKAEPTFSDTLKAFSYIFGLFFLTVILLAGADLLDQLLLWLK